MMIGTMTAGEAKVFDGSAGYHHLPDGTMIEVFWDDADVPEWGGDARNYDEDGQPVQPGWYWWACHPGCLPDGEPSGPFSSSHRALADAEPDEL